MRYYTPPICFLGILYLTWKGVSTKALTLSPWTRCLFLCLEVFFRGSHRSESPTGEGQISIFTSYQPGSTLKNRMRFLTRSLHLPQIRRSRDGCEWFDNWVSWSVNRAEIIMLTPLSAPHPERNPDWLPIRLGEILQITREAPRSQAYDTGSSENSKAPNTWRYTRDSHPFVFFFGFSKGPDSSRPLHTMLAILQGKWAVSADSTSNHFAPSDLCLYHPLPVAVASA